METKKNTKQLAELLKKLRVMSLRGEPNERIVAKSKLKEISEKYDINPDTFFLSTSKNNKLIKLKDWNDYKTIMIHCITDTNPFAEIRGNKTSRTLVVSLTTNEYNQVNLKFQHYWEQFQKEKESLLTAFIIRNNLGILDKQDDANDTVNDIDSILKYLSILKYESKALPK